MDTLEILDRLTKLQKTVEVTIYGGKGWYDKWIVKLKYDEEGTIVETVGRDEAFPLALLIAWSKFDKALEQGAAPMALMPPVEHEQLEHMPVRPSVDDEIPF